MIQASGLLQSSGSCGRTGAAPGAGARRTRNGVTTVAGLYSQRAGRYDSRLTLSKKTSGAAYDRG
jgi:hypothetical protein